MGMSQKRKLGLGPASGFAEEFEATGKAAKVDGLLKFQAQRRIDGFDFKGIDPNHPASWTKGDGGEGEKFLQQASEIGNGDAFSQGRVRDEKGDAAWGTAGNFQEIAEIILHEIRSYSG